MLLVKEKLLLLLFYMIFIVNNFLAKIFLIYDIDF